MLSRSLASNFQALSAALAVLFLQSGYCDSVSDLRGGQTNFSSPVVAEIDGDPSDGKEVAIATSDGKVHVLNSSGEILWSKSIPAVACKDSNSNDRLYSSPAVGALYGNGVPYVVVGYGGFRGKPCDGGVIAFKGSDGSQAWKFSIRAYSKQKHFFSFRNAVFGTPALADVDGDGKLEVGFGGFDRNVYLLNGDGSVRWYYQAADTVFSSPAFADIDGDGKKEMIIGTDISQNTRINPPTPNGGYLYALRTMNAKGAQFYFRDPRLVIWKAEFDQVIQSSPVVAELVSGNTGAEVVVGTGCFFPQGGGAKRGKWVKVLSAKTGQVLRTLNTTACSPSSQAVADLDGDGRNEVVATVNGTASAGGDGTSKVIAWRPDDDTVIWQGIPTVAGARDSLGGDFGKNPVVADINGDGALEVLVPHARGLAVFSAASGEPLIANGIRAAGPVQASPAVADLDGSGTLSIVMALNNRHGRLQILNGPFTGDSAVVTPSDPSGPNNPIGPFQPYFAPWAMHRGGALRSGVQQ